MCFTIFNDLKNKTQKVFYVLINALFSIAANTSVSTTDAIKPSINLVFVPLFAIAFRYISK